MTATVLHGDALDVLRTLAPGSVDARFDHSWAARCAVAPITKAAADWMIRSHYLGRWPGVVVLRLGLYLDGRAVGCIVYALPPRETSKRYNATTWELARLWIRDEMPRNSETWLIARSVEFIRKHHPFVGCLVSYADPSVGHAGTIYKAANWQSDGRTDQERKTPRFDYQDAVTGKRYSRRGHVPASAVIARVPRVSKWRYVLRIARRRIAEAQAQTTLDLVAG